MFDISFSELLVIAVVALIVVGPERLPAVARTFGSLFARMQRYIIEIKTDIAREIEIDEIKRARGDFEVAARSVEQTVTQEVGTTRKQMEDISAEAESPRSAPTPQSEKHDPKRT